MSYGGKEWLCSYLKEMVGINGTMEIWCVEIALERRQKGEIWGKIE